VKYIKLFLLILVLCPIITLAADLRVSVSKSEVVVGELISARILVSTPDQAANALSGVLSFNPSKLQVVSLSKAGSVVNLWVTEPDFSNAKGQVSFEGAILNPGFTGSSGSVLTINFKAKETGVATLSFANGSVLANDGSGTSILNKLGQATLSIKALAPKIEPVIPEEAVEPPVPASVAKVSTTVPGAPVISSPTHFDQTKWYSNRFPKLSWTLPDDVTDVSFLLNDEKTSNPGTKSDGLFNDYTADNEVPDGLWYFHLRFKNSKGWGPVSHFTLNIDGTPPNRLEVEEKTLDDLNYKTSFIFDGSDELSGLSQYEFIVDNLKPEIILADKAHLYETPALSSGNHTLTIRAVDQAGNSLEKKVNFDIISPLTKASFYRWGSNLVIILSVLVPLLALLFALLYVLLIAWRKVAKLKRSLRQEVDEVEDHIHEAFDFIREDLREQVKLIEKTKGKRKLTLLENKIMRKLRNNLDETEKYIKKDIEEIAEKVK
jgi:hypothetical protein